MKKLGIVAIVVAAVSVGCDPGMPAAAVRPHTPTAAEPMNETSCAIREDSLAPLVVDWTSSQRDELEATMHRGLAVAAYDCHTIRLLPDCHIEGTYGYSGFTKKEDVVRLESGVEVRANLPKTGGVLGVQVGGELDRGGAVEIATVTVGRRRSTRFQASPGELVGRCDGATHFVSGTHVGAFVMEGGSRAKIHTAAELFGGHVEAGAVSRHVHRTVGGVVGDCPAARANDSAPPGQCTAMIRVELAAITDDFVAIRPGTVPNADVVSCPRGLVFTEGKCAAPGATAHQCKEGDMRDCTEQCSRGNLQSCAFLAQIYELDLGPTDVSRATPLYKQACEGGESWACVNLGVMYEKGRGGAPQDEPRAVVLYKKACEAGVAQGCGNLGAMYTRGRGSLPKDEARGAALYKQACEGGSALGCGNLGTMYDRGVGVPKDGPRAAALYKQACDGKDARGCTNLGLLHALGEGAPKDASKAVALYEQGCEGGDAEGCVRLGFMFRNGAGTPKDEARAAAAYQRACDSGNPKGCSSLGLLCELGTGVAKDEARAVALYEKGCNGEDAFGCGLLAGMYDEGRGVPKDQARAAALSTRACDGGDHLSCMDLGMMYKNGRGVEKSAARAEALFKRACDGGTTKACSLLGASKGR